MYSDKSNLVCAFVKVYEYVIHKILVSISLPSRKTYKIKKMAERMRVVWPRNMVSELLFRFYEWLSVGKSFFTIRTIYNFI